MKPHNILFLAAADVRALLTIDECILAVEHALRLHGQGKTIPPAALGVHVPNGSFHVKAGTLSLVRDYFVAKVNANFPDNPSRHSLPTIQGLIVLCDAQDGVPLALMDSRDITALRTAAATAIAARYLARSDSRFVTVCGCGIQGRIQLTAIANLFPLQAVFAYDKDPRQASKFAHEVGPKLNTTITTTENLSASVRQSHICITCTTSTQPLLGAGDAPAGAFIAAVGADNPHKQEIHPSLMAQSKIVCDVIEQCETMGDLHHALNAGVVARSDVHAELSEIVAGKKPGRQSPDEIIIFDSTGMALQDVAAAAAVYEKAIQRNMGTTLEPNA